MVGSMWFLSDHDSPRGRACFLQGEPPGCQRSEGVRPKSKMSKQMMESGASGLELELRCFATFCHTRVRKKKSEGTSRSPGGTNCSANAKHVPPLAADHKSCIHLCHLRHNATPFNWKFRSLRDVTNLRSVPVLLYNLHFRTTFAMQLPQSLTFVHPVLRKSTLTP